MSTVLFGVVPGAMSEDEMAISRSTDGYRFDTPTATPAPAPAAPEPRTNAFVDSVIAENKVAVFSLEWREFTWSARRLFAAAGIDFRCVKLDSVPFRKDGPGGAIRVDLFARTGSPTIPQIFANGALIGGATECFDAFNDGILQARPKAAGVAFDEGYAWDAYAFPPAG